MLQICRYNHPNLVILLGVCPDPEHPAIIYEFMENGSLYDFLFNVSSKVWPILITTFCSVYTYLMLLRMIHLSLFKEHRKLGDIQMRCNILLQAALGLSYLHSEEGGLSAAVHLDVKRSEESEYALKYQLLITLPFVLQQQYPARWSNASQDRRFWLCNAAARESRWQELYSYLYAVWDSWLCRTRVSLRGSGAQVWCVFIWCGKSWRQTFVFVYLIMV